ncbi:MAG: GAF domain-containing protein [Nocardioidaceae bacterium]|nr:GAF domain-containing protein [Nocardioidaceae bacterium]
MSQHGIPAVRPGTDLGRHARDLLRIHDAVLSGHRAPEQPRTLVARSWRRVLEMGLDPDRRDAGGTPSAVDAARRRAASPLSLVIDDLRAVLTSAADAATYLMVVTDADGIVLWREGSARVRLTADRLGFAEGARWTEGAVGTNAIGTALAEAAPVELFSAEHFEHQQHPWYCTAAPVHDPRTGALLGVVDVSGPALTLHPALGALVESSVRLAEMSLWRRHQEGLARLRRETEHVVSTVTGPLLVVDDHGWVAHHAGVAARDRIEVPRSDRALAVPGLGLCVPERIAGERGWLVRPATPDARLAACLDLTDSPLLELTSDAGTWRTTLTRRHAEIVRLLHRAGPEGLTAASLSRAVFGDAEHVVTVRAEVSRLRRVIGALVATNPYRLADSVTLTVTPRSDLDGRHRLGQHG